MAIIVDKDGNVVTYENQPEEARELFPNIKEGGGVADVLIKGTSIVDENGDANIPITSTSAPGVSKVNSQYGISVYNDYAVIASASEENVKAGTNNYKPIVPSRQKSAAFYGLAAASGDTTQAASENLVGNYTDEAEISIQKMLGIYEAPWELIRSDTFINETEANIEITADDNSQPFELTDIRVVFTTPVQQTAASVGSYGRCRCFFGETANDLIYLGAYTQNAGAEAKTGMFAIEQKHQMVEKYAIKTTGNNSDTNIVGRNNYDITGTTHNSLWEPAASPRIYTRVSIEAVTGTAIVQVYGKRKWQ